MPIYGLVVVDAQDRPLGLADLGNRDGGNVFFDTQTLALKNLAEIEASGAKPNPPGVAVKVAPFNVSLFTSRTNTDQKWGKRNKIPRLVALVTEPDGSQVEKICDFDPAFARKYMERWGD